MLHFGKKMDIQVQTTEKSSQVKHGKSIPEKLSWDGIVSSRCTVTRQSPEKSERLAHRFLEINIREALLG